MVIRAGGTARPNNFFVEGGQRESFKSRFSGEERGLPGLTVEGRITKRLRLKKQGGEVFTQYISQQRGETFPPWLGVDQRRRGERRGGDSGSAG